jgi:hypothetical protein
MRLFRSMVLALGLIAPAAAANLPAGFPGPTPAATIEVKQYPPFRGARYRLTQKLESAESVAFRPLFRHIQRHDIGMTAPVLTDFAPTQAEVFFLYARPDMGTLGPDQEVEVVDVPAVQVVSIGLRGPYTWGAFQTGVQQLEEWLARNPGYQAAGVPRRLCYNSPFTWPGLMASDVQIPIVRK